MSTDSETVIHSEVQGCEITDSGDHGSPCLAYTVHRFHYYRALPKHPTTMGADPAQELFANSVSITVVFEAWIFARIWYRYSIGIHAHHVDTDELRRF